MKLLKIFLVVLAIGFTSSSYALITSMGDRSCGQWVANRTSHNVSQHFDSDWLTGMLTGMAVYSGVDILKDSEGESIFLWMDNYCKSNPLDKVGTGASVLFYELKQRMHK